MKLGNQERYKAVVMVVVKAVVESAEHKDCRIARCLARHSAALEDTAGYH